MSELNGTDWLNQHLAMAKKAVEEVQKIIAEAQFETEPFEKTPYVDQFPDEPEWAPRYHLRVGQGNIKTSSKEALQSEGFGNCVALVLKGSKAWALLHVEPEDVHGEQEYKLKRFLEENGGVGAVIVRATESSGHLELVEQLDHWGVNLRKIIEVDNGRLHYSVSYRPETNEVLFQNKKKHELWKFRGF